MDNCCPKKCEDCNSQKMIEEIEACNFECEGGDLRNHAGWIALKHRVTVLEASLDVLRGSTSGD